jgi:hypothetical protein
VGRPTIASQIAKAAQLGDIEKVKELAAKLEIDKKTKSKIKTKAKAKRQTKIKVDETEIYKPDDHEETVNPFAEFTAPARNDKIRDGTESYTDQDGNERVRSRVVPFKVVKNRKNKFKDDLTEETADIEFDKKTHVSTNKIKKTKLQHRPPTTKVKVRCIRCKELKVVWPGEIMHRNWACDTCLKNNIPMR